MTEEENMFSELIGEILKEPKLSAKTLNNIKIKYAKKYKYNKIIKNPQILAYCNENQREKVIRRLNIKPIRELSGVTVVALFAKPHSCPHGKCIYCPGGVGSAFGDTPQSYTGKEPAAMRAIRNDYDPYLQIFNRLEHYIINGHLPDKLELIFMGGTFPSLDRDYRDEFVTFVYKAINDFGELFIKVKKNNKIIDYSIFNEFFETKEEFDSIERAQRLKKKILDLKYKDIQSLEFEINRNERANIRSIGLTIETKPDWAQEEHCNEMLRYGCTRFEVGVQTLDDECLKKTNRGHTLKDTQEAFSVMKDMCFKINAHMMIGLPNAQKEKGDLWSLRQLFENADFRPDMLKIYPCLVVKGTPLYKLWERGEFNPIDTKEAARVISIAFKYFPRYVRVMRVQRDIPTTVIEKGGVSNSNLRQYVDEEMKLNKIESKDIRAREISFRLNEGYKLGDFEIREEKYESSGGIDYFIDVVDENDTMIGFIRLRFPSRYGLRPEIEEGCALIRELHIYGQTTSVGKIGTGVQHKGWGRKLLKRAEEIAKENGFKKMAIISGIGVREYYRKFGYELEGVYMTKKI